jgi:uncharacterized protein YegP (UPF0339 family)
MAAIPILPETASTEIGQPRKNSSMKYVIYRDGMAQWRWRLVAANGKIIANSGEAYFNKQDCIGAISLVKSSGNAPVVEQ